GVGRGRGVCTRAGIGGTDASAHDTKGGAELTTCRNRTYSPVRRRLQHPRTPGRTAISVVAVTPRREFIKYPG
ncbi:MAG: hypothetical protein P8075_19230, partial [Deltaproteobacteria bacterium]